MEATGEMAGMRPGLSPCPSHHHSHKVVPCCHASVAERRLLHAVPHTVYIAAQPRTRYGLHICFVELPMSVLMMCMFANAKYACHHRQL